MPETRINTGFRHLNPLFKLGKFRDVLKYICLSFVSFLPLFYFCCIYYFGSLIFCCQFVAIKLLCNITSTFQQIISLRELNFYGSHIPSLANVDWINALIKSIDSFNSSLVNLILAWFSGWWIWCLIYSVNIFCSSIKDRKSVV